VEKLIYALWAPDGDRELFSRRLRSEVAPKLLGAGARYLSISVADDHVGAGWPLRIGSMQQPKDAMISFWLRVGHDRAECEHALAAESARIAGYLVSESRPLVTPAANLGAIGERTTGFHLVTCFGKREDLDHREFIHRWHGAFSEVAIGLQSTWDYVRNEVVRPLTKDAPRWDGVVEEAFPIAALDEPAAFFDVGDDEDLLSERQQAMFEAVQQFLDISTVESHPMSQYVYEPGPDVSQ
jgi:hypothetical protein